MRDSMNSIYDAIKIRSKILWIETYEEDAFIKDLLELTSGFNIKMPIFTYSSAFSLQKISTAMEEENYSFARVGDNKILEMIYQLTRDCYRPDPRLDGDINVEFESSNIFIFKDFHDMLTNPQIRRGFRDIAEGSYSKYNLIIMLSPITKIPAELEKVVTPFVYDIPDKAFIKDLIKLIISEKKKQDYTDEEMENIVNSCKGLTLNEMLDAVKMSILKNGEILPSVISNFKLSLIKKSNILEYKMPNVKLSDIGGNSSFKKWIKEIKYSMSDDAIEFGCDRPKGYLALGIPGSAKTMLAEALANEMNISYIKLDMSKILDSRVGNSEKNISQAMRLVKAMAPCVLLIDEIEKTLSGK